MSSNLDAQVRRAPSSAASEAEMQRAAPAPFSFPRRRALLLLVDAALVAISFYLALWLRFARTPPDRYLDALRVGIPFIILTFLGTNFLFGAYRHIWRYASGQELVNIIGAAFTSTLIIAAVDLFWPGVRPLPITAVFVGGFFSLIGFAAVRYRRRLITGGVRRWRGVATREPGEARSRQRVLIVGAGEAGQLLGWRFLNLKEGAAYKVIGFVDDDPAKRGLRVHGLPVFGGRKRIPHLVDRHRVDLIVLAMYNIASADFRDILSICERTATKIKVLPNLFEFLEGRNGPTHIRDVTVQDLLGRQPVHIDIDVCRQLIAGKTVLVTGAAGSIGAELCRQIRDFDPELLLALDNNESGLHNLLVDDLSPTDQLKDPQVKAIIGDVTRRGRMAAVFTTYRPQIVFHSAAYKHVPLMEANPEEAVRVNVGGTRLMVELAQEHGVERFVLVSTDKAVNPSSVMGATKRLCEMLVRNGSPGFPPHAEGAGKDEQGGQRTRFCAVRFGNVLGSRGSVVPTFERQIDHGGPVTVTHPEMSRYFMTIPEAVSLIIQAAALTIGGDTFMLDMGRRINIEDLARRLIRLRGLRPEIDIPIVYTGARPGEKMHEELIGEDERSESTVHDHILRVHTDQSADNGDYQSRLEALLSMPSGSTPEAITERIFEMIEMEPVFGAS
jgi:FlaA1/EpsC-like NDP-sugar epimerase